MLPTKPTLAHSSYLSSSTYSWSSKKKFMNDSSVPFPASTSLCLFTSLPDIYIYIYLHPLHNTVRGCHTHLRCTAVAGCVYRSRLLVIRNTPPTYIIAAAVCDRPRLTLDGNVNTFWIECSIIVIHLRSFYCFIKL